MDAVTVNSTDANKVNRVSEFTFPMYNEPRSFRSIIDFLQAHKYLFSQFWRSLGNLYSVMLDYAREKEQNYICQFLHVLLYSLSMTQYLPQKTLVYAESTGEFLQDNFVQFSIL